MPRRGEKKNVNEPGETESSVKRKSTEERKTHTHTLSLSCSLVFYFAQRQTDASFLFLIFKVARIDRASLETLISIEEISLGKTALQPERNDRRSRIRIEKVVEAASSELLSEPEVKHLSCVSPRVLSLSSPFHPILGLIAKVESLKSTDRCQGGSRQDFDRNRSLPRASNGVYTCASHGGNLSVKLNRYFQNTIDRVPKCIGTCGRFKDVTCSSLSRARKTVGELCVFRRCEIMHVHTCVIRRYFRKSTNVKYYK